MVEPLVPATWEPIAAFLLALRDQLVHRGILVRTLSQAISEQNGLSEVQRWRTVRGPMGAMAASLYRVGWQLLDPMTWVDHAGVRFEILICEPRFLKQAVIASVRHTLWKPLASRVQFGSVPLLSPLFNLLCR